MTPPPWEAPLRRYPTPYRPASPPTPLGNAGGYSGARLWRIDAPAGPLVLRLWPVDGPGRPSLEIIHGWLARGRDLPFLPAPIPALDGRTLVALGGRLWELAPWLPGRADHFLFEADALTGLVDFGAMGRDTVAADLARLLADALGPDRSARAGALAAYEALRPLRPAESLAIPAFERANALLTAGHWARWHFLEGRRFDDPEAVAQGLRRGLEQLDDLGLMAP